MQTGSGERDALAALQHAAAQDTGPGGVAAVFQNLQQQLPVVQQHLLTGDEVRQDRSRDRQTACADNGLLPCLQGERLRERSDAKLRPLHVDQKLGALAAASRGFVHGKDLRSGVGQRDMGQIQPKTGHTGFKHGCERFRIRTGGADGSVKIQHTVFLTSKIFCFYSITRFGKSAKGESASDDRMQSEARSEDTGHLLDSI